MSRMRFFEKFEMVRDRAGFTSSAVADATGIAKSTISNWEGREADEIKVNLAAMGKLARMLCVPLDYLADDAQDDPPMPELTDEERPLLDMIRVLGVEEARRRLLQMPPNSEVRWTGTDSEPGARLLHEGRSRTGRSATPSKPDSSKPGSGPTDLGNTKSRRSRSTGRK